MVMKETDCTLATGGPGMVKAAYSSGKPAIGVGAGNVLAVIDEAADILLAVNFFKNKEKNKKGEVSPLAPKPSAFLLPPQRWASPPKKDGVGLKWLGFIEAALRLSSKFPQYFPHWLNTTKFQADLDLFNAVRSLVEICRSLEEKAWNINVEASDMVYTDALEYYSQVQDAARRRVDSVESIYAELHDFFRRGTMESDQPTQKKIKRDVDALLHGRKDGEVIIKNIKPKTTGDKHEVIDETFKDSASFKETKKGKITE
jgi:hypothetical protein